MKSVILLGSTGSIGRQTLEVIRKYNDEFFVLGLACNSNVELLNAQIEEFKPRYVCLTDKTKESLLVKGDYVIVRDIDELAEIDCDITLNAVVGISGLTATLKTLERGGTLALANKESMVTGGEYINANRQKYCGKILPVDSEHSAIFQCLHYERPNEEVHKLILTASGGAFRDFTKEMLENVRATDALKHPNWNMGKKITIDCATMMNKGLEVLEAMYLYGLPSEKIDVVIHKQSIVHSMVEFVDGAVLAQMGYPSMIVPIQLALTFPSRKPSAVSYLDFSKVTELNFALPYYDRFPVLRTALNVAKEGGIFPIIMNGANEVLVDLFLKDKIKYNDIAYYLDRTLEKFQNERVESVQQIKKIDELSRKVTTELIKR
ncbi:MAG: 1-deoxy-D-xylulose-5-phosphate reductoisomerase [Eubacteriales bacterium]|nr:1-deoxy-D-xylulose-5-phosphate reductoisomerase [Eubacteriales bacterium]